VAVPAEAATPNAISTPTYYVTGPMVGSTSDLTPESATVSGVIDTGADTEALLPIPASGLSWDGGVSIKSGVPWADNSSGDYVPLNGIPASGSNSNVSATVVDGGTTTTNPVSNQGANNYSTVTFAYDPASDYVASGNQPGGETLYAAPVNVPTTTGLSSVQATIGAFGQAAQAQAATLPLQPNTAYYVWLSQQAGGTDAATSVNLAQWEGASTNPFNVCLPNVAIAQDPTLAGYVANNPTVTYDGKSAPASAGACVYYYGDANGQNTPLSAPVEFTTPAIGKIVIGRRSRVTGRVAPVTVTDKSEFKAAGMLELANAAGDTLASGKFSLQPGKAAVVKLKLTSAGVKAAAKNRTGQLSLTSDWDQPTSTTKIKLLGRTTK
jgi:hypothetical protein